MFSKSLKMNIKNMITDDNNMYMSIFSKESKAPSKLGKYPRISNIYSLIRLVYKFIFGSKTKKNISYFIK